MSSVPRGSFPPNCFNCQPSDCRLKRVNFRAGRAFCEKKCNALWRQTAVTAHFLSKQLVLSAFPLQTREKVALPSGWTTLVNHNQLLVLTLIDTKALHCKAKGQQLLTWEVSCCWLLAVHTRAMTRPWIDADAGAATVKGAVIQKWGLTKRVVKETRCGGWVIKIWFYVSCCAEANGGNCSFFHQGWVGKHALNYLFSHPWLIFIIVFAYYYRGAHHCRTKPKGSNYLFEVTAFSSAGQNIIIIHQQIWTYNWLIRCEKRSSFIVNPMIDTHCLF